MDMQRVGSPAPVEGRAETKAVDVDVDMEVDAALATQEAGDEERKENEGSSSSSSSDSSSDGSSTEGEPEEDAMDMPSTQVLADDMEMENTVERPVAASPVHAKASPVKKAASPAQRITSPIKSILSPKKSIPSPAKRVVSPKKVSSSPSKLFASPKKAKTSPKKVAVSPAKAVEAEAEPETPTEFQTTGPAAHFTKMFPQVSRMLETSGWQIAQGPNTLLCAMPGVQFFNFKPNINVFDTKLKACWKFIALAGAKPDEMADAELWDLLWPVAQRDFGWFTMQCGPETWFVKPNTQFQDFMPNETIFQTKKRAVLKCLALEVGHVELGDSGEGHQVVSFAPRQPKKPVASKSSKVSSKATALKTPSPAVKSSSKSTPTSVRSPKATLSASTGAKRKLTPSSSKSSTGKKKLKSDKKKPKKKKKPVPAVELKKAEVFNFTPPEFRCTFGLVYAQLQKEGWTHRTGVFEYDYFSPTYTDENKQLNVNYFRSVADLEEYLKVSGEWKRVEDALRDEHQEVVDELREEALEKHHRQLEKNEARKKQQAVKKEAQSKPKATEAPKKSRKKVTKKKSETKKPIGALGEPVMVRGYTKVPMGTMIDKLKDRGWFYRPGRFEYDYFKPNANLKTAVSGEDRFESQAALEEYLKTSGLWQEIARELEDDKLAQEQLEEDEALSQSQSQSLSPVASRLEAAMATTTSGTQKDEVKAMTNDIWANSHEFEFNE